MCEYHIIPFPGRIAKSIRKVPLEHLGTYWFVRGRIGCFDQWPGLSTVEADVASTRPVDARTGR